MRAPKLPTGCRFRRNHMRVFGKGVPGGKSFSCVNLLKGCPVEKREGSPSWFPACAGMTGLKLVVELKIMIRL